MINMETQGRLSLPQALRGGDSHKPIVFNVYLSLLTRSDREPSSPEDLELLVC